jgi:hypothetical protein
LVGHRELALDRWVLLAELGQTDTHSRQRRFRRQSSAGRPGTSERRLDLAQLVAQLGFDRHRAASSLVLQTTALHPAALTSTLDFAVHVIRKKSQFATRKYNYHAPLETLT